MIQRKKPLKPGKQPKRKTPLKRSTVPLRKKSEKPSSRKAAIPRQSAKMAAAMKIYGPRAKRFRKDNQLCLIGSPVCTIHTTCVHHAEGKESVEKLLNEKMWIPSCWPCNLWVEQNSKQAYEMQVKFSKFKANALPDHIASKIKKAPVETGAEK